MHKLRSNHLALLASVVVLAILAAACGSKSGAAAGGSSGPGFTIAYGQGNIANSDSILDSDPALAEGVDAKLHFIPFDAGVTAIAEMRSGSLQAISGVGNPPVVGAIGTGTGIVVVIAQSFDDDALIVPASITDASQLAGKTVGVLVGSSEDFELRGWLELQHLTDKVQVLGLASEQAVAAAYLSGKIAGGYVQGGPEAQLTQKGGHALINAEQIAKLGIPGLNVVAVSQSFAKDHPSVVQQYVSAEVAATKLFTGPQADKYLAQAAGVQGVPANLIVAATKDFPFIPLDQQLHWLGDTPNDVNSPIVKAYAQTAQFLVGQGRISKAPATSEIATHVDSTYVKNALAGHC